MVLWPFDSSTTADDASCSGLERSDILSKIHEPVSHCQFASFHPMHGGWCFDRDQFHCGRSSKLNLLCPWPQIGLLEEHSRECLLFLPRCRWDGHEPMWGPFCSAVLFVALSVTRSLSGYLLILSFTFTIWWRKTQPFPLLPQGFELLLWWQCELGACLVNHEALAQHSQSTCGFLYATSFKATFKTHAINAQIFRNMHKENNYFIQTAVMWSVKSATHVSAFVGRPATFTSELSWRANDRFGMKTHWNSCTLPRSK